MSHKNVRHINEILASIEALNAQADDLSREQAVSAARPKDMPRSMVAEMAERQADIVLLDEIYWKGGAEGDRAVRQPVDVKTPKVAVNDEAASDAEFDQMLSALMKDMGRSKARLSPAGTAGEPVASLAANSSSDSLSDLKADIDDLLSPYVDVPAPRAPRATEIDSPRPAAKQPAAERISEQARTTRSGAGASLIAEVMTDELRAQVAEFVLQEIKHQISGWIAQNLDKIVEDALRSVPTESRDASRTRSAS